MGFPARPESIGKSLLRKSHYRLASTHHSTPRIPLSRVFASLAGIPLSRTRTITSTTKLAPKFTTKLTTKTVPIPPISALSFVASTSLIQPRRVRARSHRRTERNLELPDPAQRGSPSTERAREIEAAKRIAEVD